MALFASGPTKRYMTAVGESLLKLSKYRAKVNKLISHPSHHVNYALKLYIKFFKDTELLKDTYLINITQAKLFKYIETPIHLINVIKYIINEEQNRLLKEIKYVTNFFHGRKRLTRNSNKAQRIRTQRIKENQRIQNEKNMAEAIRLANSFRTRVKGYEDNDNRPNNRPDNRPVNWGNNWGTLSPNNVLNNTFVTANSLGIISKNNQNHLNRTVSTRKEIYQHKLDILHEMLFTLNDYRGELTECMLKTNDSLLIELISGYLSIYEDYQKIARLSLSGNKSEFNVIMIDDILRKFENFKSSPLNIGILDELIDSLTRIYTTQHM